MIIYYLWRRMNFSINNVKLLGVVLLTSLLVLNYTFEKWPEGIWFSVLFLLKIVNNISLLLILVIIVSKSIKQQLLTSWKLGVMSIMLILLFLELIFSFVDRSHHAEVSYASIIWQKRFYHLNEEGWRDLSLKKKDSSKPALVFSGDSFSAGYGVQVGKRYSDIIQQKLSNTFEIYNTGLKGTGLKEHLPQLEKIPAKEKILFYQIYINDLDDFCHRTKENNFDIYCNFSTVDRYIFKASFFLNYVYFSFPNNRLIQSYYGFFRSCYENDVVLDEYNDHLKAMLTKLLQTNQYKKAYVFVMPTLADITMGAAFEQTIRTSLQSINGITFFSVTDKLANLPVKERIVNTQDTHASEKANAVIAQIILDTYNRQTDN